jgi:hypothetical protein
MRGDAQLVRQELQPAALAVAPSKEHSGEADIPNIIDASCQQLQDSPTPPKLYQKCLIVEVASGLSGAHRGMEVKDGH